MCITTTASTVAELAGPTMAVVLDVMTVISTVNTPHQSAMATLIFVDVGMTQTAIPEISVIQTQILVKNSPMNARPTPIVMLVLDYLESVPPMMTVKL